MLGQRISYLFLCGVVSVTLAAAGENNVEKGEEVHDVAWHLQTEGSLKAIQDEPGKPRVLLIGDSNSIGYTLPVREFLKGKVNLHRIPKNGGPTTRGLQYLDQWLGEEKWDVISFNWGAHDLKLTEEGTHLVELRQYEDNLRKLVERLKKTGAVLIWVNTAPVPDGVLSPPRKNEDVIAFNAAARRVMEDNGIMINDIYSLAYPRLRELQIPENVHFTRHGYRILGEAVAKHIIEAIGD